MLLLMSNSGDYLRAADVPSYDEDTFYFRTRSNKLIEMKCTDVRKMAWCLNNESLAGSIAIRKFGSQEWKRLSVFRTSPAISFIMNVMTVQTVRNNESWSRVKYSCPNNSPCMRK